MIWIEFVFKVKKEFEFKDILIAKLSSLGFDSFDETKDLKAYINKEKVTDSFLEEVKRVSQSNFNISILENKNWNLIWEKNFNPIMIGKSCFIRAPFHEKRKVKYDILINPKMAFGTGHHETTRMMVLELFNLKSKPKKVLDVGCGTGILSIICEKKWACQVNAIDIDDWAIQNSLENIKMNKCVNIKIEKGNISSQVNSSKFDLILANINTNVLIQDLKSYFKLLNLNGFLIMSGFLCEDFLRIQKEASLFNLFLISKKQEKKWECVVFKKTD